MAVFISGSLPRSLQNKRKSGRKKGAFHLDRCLPPVPTPHPDPPTLGS